MFRPFRRLVRAAWPVVAAGAAIVALAPVVPAGAAPPAPSALSTRVEAYLQPYLETGNFSGVVLIARGAEVVYEGGFGYADRELRVPARPEQVFHVASVSKPFTAAAILRLEELGRLRTSDPLARHLPGYPNGDRITIHHLLTHASGIPNINSFDDYDAWSRFPQTPAGLVERFRELPLLFEPGSRYGYSNSNYNLLALLIERLSGLAFGDFLDRELFAPLGMTRTGHHGDAGAIVPGHVSGYVPSGRDGAERAPYLDWSIKVGNGSLHTTAADLLRWTRAWADGKVLSEASRASALTEHLENVGYGWFLRQRHGGREIYINGRSPGFGAYLGRYAAGDLTVAVLMNLYSTLPTTIGRDLAGLALGLPIEPPRFSSARPDPELVRAAVGSYRFGPDYYQPNATIEVFERDGHLFCTFGWLMPEGERTFRDRTYWTEVELLPDEDGAILGLRIDDYRGERLASGDGER